MITMRDCVLIAKKFKTQEEESVESVYAKKGTSGSTTNAYNKAGNNYKSNSNMINIETQFKPSGEIEV